MTAMLRRRSTWATLAAALALPGCAALAEEQRQDDIDRAVLAVGSGDREEVEELLSAHEFLRSSPSGAYVVVAAACDPEMLRFVLDSGVDPDVRFESGSGPIYELAFFGADEGGSNCAEVELAESIEVLVERGANPCREMDSALPQMAELQPTELAATSELRAVLENVVDSCQPE